MCPPESPGPSGRRVRFGKLLPDQDRAHLYRPLFHHIRRRMPTCRQMDRGPISAISTAPR